MYGVGKNDGVEDIGASESGKGGGGSFGLSGRDSWAGGCGELSAVAGSITGLFGTLVAVERFRRCLNSEVFLVIKDQMPDWVLGVWRVLAGGREAG